MARFCTTIFITFLISTSVLGQTLTYEVMRGGKSMGQSVVKRDKKPNSVSYHLNTKTEFRVIFLIEVEYDLQEEFTKGCLTAGTGFNTLNGSLQKKTELKKRTKDYSLVIDGIHTTISEDSIFDSVSEIYFEEPYDEKKVFSAYFGRYLTFEKTKDHQYVLTSPDGSNTYTYENGICVRVDISRDFATFSQVLQPDMLARVRKKEIKLE
ncbi:MAG: hypothetical protein JXR10_02635 [Cyclobacteriaceae bacterium]